MNQQGWLKTETGITRETNDSVTTGIGLLGAGVIMKERLTIPGLTTAASIWMTAAVGIVIGLGFYFAAGAAVLVALVTLSLFPWVEKATLRPLRRAVSEVCEHRSHPGGKTR